MEKVKMRGLVRLCGWIFAVCAVSVLIKGFYDIVGGQPEANLYSPEPWGFVTREQWRRYAFFEVAYGVVCGAVAWLLFSYAGWLPFCVERARTRGNL